METEKSKFCPAMWLSGFFALGALVHLIRYLLHFSLTVNGYEVPLTASFGVAVLFGAFALVFGAAGMKRPCEKNQKSGSCGCKHS